MRRHCYGLIVAALTACGGANDSTAPSNTTTQSQPVSTIVYTVSNGTTVGIVLTTLDGSNTRTVPCPESYCLDGEISPNGKQLLVTGSNAAGVRQQYVMGTDGSNPRLVASTPLASMFPTWKHNGTAYYSYGPASNGGTRAYLTDIATGVAQPIELLAIHSGLPTESPDGKQLVFASDRRGFVGDELHSLDLTSASAIPVLIPIVGLPASGGTTNQPRFSPAGDQIAFTYTPAASANFDIWLMNANGTNARPFMNSTQREFLPEWSPDGAYVVFVRSPALNTNEIVIARVNDGTIVRTIPQPAGGTVNYPRWGVIR